jgi:hypothetical protein
MRRARRKPTNMNTAKELVKYNARRAPAGRERRWLWSTVGWAGVEEVAGEAGPEDCDGVGGETGIEAPSDGRFCAVDMVENSFDDGDRHGNFKAGTLWHWDNKYPFQRCKRHEHGK